MGVGIYAYTNVRKVECAERYGTDCERAHHLDALLHEATVHGYLRDPETDDQVLVIGRRRPFIPCGEDPADVNRECARRFALQPHEGGFLVVEVDPGMVVPFVDIAAIAAAEHKRANAAQDANVKPAKDGAEIDLDKLTKLALATMFTRETRWTVHDGFHVEWTCVIDGVDTTAPQSYADCFHVGDAAFIAAATPDVVLALIARIRGLESRTLTSEQAALADQALGRMASDYNDTTAAIIENTRRKLEEIMVEKSITELIEKSSVGEAMRDVEERGIDAHLADPRTKP